MKKWVIGVKNGKQKLVFVSEKDDSVYTHSLEKARLYETRGQARKERTFSIYGLERVYKTKHKIAVDTTAKT